MNCSAAAATAKVAKTAAAAKAAQAAAAAAESQTKVCMFSEPCRITVAILAQGTPSWPMRLRRPFVSSQESEPQRVHTACLCKKRPDCHTDWPTPEVTCLPLRLTIPPLRTLLSFACSVASLSRCPSHYPPGHQGLRQAALVECPLGQGEPSTRSEGHGESTNTSLTSFHLDDRKA